MLEPATISSDCTDYLLTLTAIRLYVTWSEEVWHRPRAAPLVPARSLLLFCAGGTGRESALQLAPIDLAPLGSEFEITLDHEPYPPPRHPLPIHVMDQLQSMSVEEISALKRDALFKLSKVGFSRLSP